MADQVNVLPSQVHAAAIIQHILQWGEISRAEAEHIKDSDLSLALLQEANLVAPVYRAGEVVAWSISPNGSTLLDFEPSGAFKAALFQFPIYRSYLISILAEGVVAAAKAGMQDRVESWTAVELAGLLPDINFVLDGLEVNGVRLVDSTTANIRARFAATANRSNNFSAWDQLLLGQTAQPSDLFDFALRRFAPIAALPQPNRAAGNLAILRALPLNDEDGFSPQSLIRAEPWSTRRLGIQSSVPLFDELGHPIVSPSTCSPFPGSIQDALLAQPFYQAVVQLAICSWRSPAADLPTVELLVSPKAEHHDVAIAVGGSDVGRLRDLLCDLMAALDVYPLGFRDRLVPAALMGNVIRNLIATGILVAVEDRLELQPDFQASLVGHRLRTLFRPGKVFQHNLLQILEGLQAKRKAQVG